MIAMQGDTQYIWRHTIYRNVSGEDIIVFYSPILVLALLLQPLNISE